MTTACRVDAASRSSPASKEHSLLKFRKVTSRLILRSLQRAGYQVTEYITFPGFEITVSRPGGPAPTLAELAAFGHRPGRAGRRGPPRRQLTSACTRALTSRRPRWPSTTSIRFPSRPIKVRRSCRGSREGDNGLHQAITTFPRLATG